ncbi:carbohydrate esterase family 12 protein [Aaosphaeria arxii CBS 175.79]|uniref:Carbohydrate esterase family 12 protein n=1 Tax=Aaosphaeria arxii CBS 175.79 TaxID=1450172 RepID=A0A6A5XU22_9PLEO|nr:carbohydrate esterase family 12 protein [Aaosphaeria arxii CBS 175.79]KAF2016307.1 carbohydrate esterase family 12 protein [Aaosphaeria arxii CBS 175.79]
MVATQFLYALGLATTALGAPHVEKRAQTVWLAGDSTMAKASGTQQGWGVYLPYSLSLPVTNNAIGGRSARSFTVEGRFQTIIDSVKANDIVIIEFGHNDGGSLNGQDNGRTACPGAGDETCQSTYNGQAVTVLTYPKYLTNAGKALVAKGAKVIISSPTPNNPWEGGSFSYAPGRFTTYSRDVAKAIGANAIFVDHGQYTANIFQTLGKAKVDAFFPNDHTHTSPAGADVVQRAFVKGLLCQGGGFLNGFIKNSTASVEGKCI